MTTLQGRLLRRQPVVHVDQPHPVRALIRLAPEDLEFSEIPIGNLPLYSQDYDATIRPRPWR